MIESTKWKQAGLPPPNPDNIFEKLREYPNDFVSFRSMIKMGINPDPIDKATPIGIYAFPIQCIQTEKDMGIFSHYPYFYIIAPKPGTKILEIKDSTSKEIYSKFEEEAWEERIPSHSAMKAIRANKRQMPGMRLNKLLREAGYDGVIDWGTGTISFNERCQAVFLTIAAINVIDMFKNPTKTPVEAGIGSASKLF